MAVQTRSVSRHPARNEQIEQWLTMRGVKYSFKPDLPLGRIDEAASLHNQARQVSFDQDRADKLMQAYTEGFTLPALVVIRHGDGYLIIDGNHRFWVFKTANEGTIPVYEVDAKIPATLLQDLIFEANVLNGDRPSRNDSLQHALYYHSNGMTQVAAANKAQIELEYFRAEVNKRKNIRKAQALNIPEAHYKKYSAPSLNAIFGDRGLRLNAEMVNFVRFTHHLNLTQADIKNLVTEAKQIKTDKERMEFINAIPQRYASQPTRRSRRRLKNIFNAQSNGVIKCVTVDRQEILDDTTALEREEMKSLVYELIKQLDDFRQALDDAT